MNLKLQYNQKEWSLSLSRSLPLSFSLSLSLSLSLSHTHTHVGIIMNNSFFYDMKQRIMKVSSILINSV